MSAIKPCIQTHVATQYVTKPSVLSVEERRNRDPGVPCDAEIGAYMVPRDAETGTRGFHEKEEMKG